MSMDLSEKQFESDIENWLITDGGYEQFSYLNPDGHRIHKFHYDKERAIYLDVLVDFVAKTQPKAWSKYEYYYKHEAKDRLYHRVQQSIENNGLIYTLKNGIEDMGIKINLCYFKPVSELNATQAELYRGNILGCTRQFAYSPKNNNTIDMVLSLNGFPLIALELKNQYMGQNVDNAMKQYRTDRNSKEFCFKLNNRFLAYFAVDLYEAYMTTALADGETRFMPFNQGSNGAGNAGGKGNPQPEDGEYVTAYLWKEVLCRDGLLELLNKFVTFVSEKSEVEQNGSIKIVKKDKLIVPRFHQLDVVRKIVGKVLEDGVGKNYLIEHSAGSGKSNSIAWIAYRLASLHDQNNEPVFDSVIVVTNRIVLDNQLQDTINSFDHTPGLVEAIDQKKHSKGLVEAINDRKRIIICTIQKFLFAYKDFDDMKGRKFAIIIDEAHQGQSGESAKTLRKALVDPELAIKAYAEEEGVGEDELDDGDAMLITLMSQGMHANQSFFAFTATPTAKTLELFGTPTSNGKMRPFHVYSMAQAIEEGFILDVLAGYTTVKETFKLVKVSADNPELLESQALKAMVRYYKEHGHTIGQKTELIMSNFLENGRFQIDGKGKAMIVADSRANAVRYFFAVKEYLKKHPEEGKGCGVMVAFSGTVDIDGVKYAEADLNKDAEGNPILSDKKFRREFHSPRKNILVVANKYQTGFDEPQLHSMFVDKKLKGVNAVQTLSRLNRTMPGKTSTFVLDFENTDEDIRKSFQPFYETTLLEGRSDFNRVYDLRGKIKEFMLYNQDDVSKYYDFMNSEAGKKQDPVALGKLSNIIKPILERYDDLGSDEEKFNARLAIRKFVKAYAYITQIVRIHDDELFKEYVFCLHLSKLLPVEKAQSLEWLDKIKLEYASLKETFKGAIILDKKDVDLIPQPKNSKPKLPKKDLLDKIVDKLNDRYGDDFNDSDRVLVDSIFKMFMGRKGIEKYRKFAKENDEQMFTEAIFSEEFKNIAVKCRADQSGAYAKLFADDQFYQQIMRTMAKEIYNVLRSDDEV